MVAGRMRRGDDRPPDAGPEPTTARRATADGNADRGGGEPQSIRAAHESVRRAGEAPGRASPRESLRLAGECSLGADEALDLRREQGDGEGAGGDPAARLD